jgi:hypothetical protein
MFCTHLFHTGRHPTRFILGIHVGIVCGHIFPMGWILPQECSPSLNKFVRKRTFLALSTLGAVLAHF